MTLPFVVLRRLDCVLEGRKEDIRDRHEDLEDQLDPDQLEKALLGATDLSFYNVSDFDLGRLTRTPIASS